MDLFLQYGPLLLTLLVVGAISGLSAGLFGIGGGAVMVPPLLYAFRVLGVAPDVTMQCAIATSSAVIIVNAYRSVRSHHARQSVDWSLLWPRNPLLSYALWIAIGSGLASALLVKQLSSQNLELIFAVVASVVAMQFIFGRPDWKLRDNVPGGLARPVVGGSVGALSSLMGIGGGSFTVPLMSICGVPIHRAVGTASGFGFAIAVPATLGFIYSGWAVAGRPPFSLGFVNILGFMAIAAMAFFTVPLGAKLAHRLDQRKLKLIFGLCLLAVAINMAREVLF